MLHDVNSTCQKNSRDKGKKSSTFFFNILDFDKPQIIHNLGLVKIQNVEKKRGTFFPLSLEFFLTC